MAKISGSGQQLSARNGPKNVYFLPQIRPTLLFCGMATNWFSNERVDAAYEWLRHRRKHFPANADIWWFRQRWPAEKALLVKELETGRMRFEPLRQVTLGSGETIEVWSARDALVLKLLAWSLSEILPSSPRCTHLKGHGGAKHAVREVVRHLPRHQFVMRTDVKSYYASIDHHELLEKLALYVRDRVLLNLIGQYLQRNVEHGGLYRQIDKGFDFLGYHFSPEGLSVAEPTVRRFIEKAARLYEQEKGKPEGFLLLGLYKQRWRRWTTAGLASIGAEFCFEMTIEIDCVRRCGALKSTPCGWCCA